MSECLGNNNEIEIDVRAILCGQTRHQQTTHTTASRRERRGCAVACVAAPGGRAALQVVLASS